MAKSIYCPAPRRKNHTSAKPGNYTPPVPGFQRPINSLSNMVLIEELSKRPATPNDETFERVILALIEQARQTGQPYVDIVSGEVHRLVGGYPGRNHKMPTCCKVMYRLMKPGDEVLARPPKGLGVSVKIRYYL